MRRLTYLRRLPVHRLLTVTTGLREPTPIAGSGGNDGDGFGGGETETPAVTIDSDNDHPRNY